MDKNQSIQYSPIEGYYWIENQFFEFLKKVRLVKDEKWKEFLERYKEKFEINSIKVNSLIKNDLDKGNVYFTLLTVSAYEVFLDFGIPKNEAILLTDECLNNPIRGIMSEGTRQMLDNSDNPFKSLVDVSKDREKNYFGESFEFDRPIDNEYGYVLHIKKCFYHIILKELSRTELQHTLCRIDLGWINGIEPDKHNLQFVRPITFATGNTCQMWFMKKEKEMIKIKCQ